MAVFIVARCAIHDGTKQAIQNIGLLTSDTQASAENIAKEKSNVEFPPLQGWNHVTMVLEVSKKMLLRLAQDAT